MKRIKERISQFCIYVLPTLCFLTTTGLYMQQKRKLQSVANLFKVDYSDVDMKELEKRLSFVEKGGWYKPAKCGKHNDKKVAILVPFRNRHKHLGVFLQHMHPFLKKQEIYYRIFVIEQMGEKLFNRGKLINVGFKEAAKIDSFNCYIFHDIDLIPLNEGNEYFCPTSPRHMSAAADKWGYKLPYQDFFGGVSAIQADQFKAANGFPNRYWGWGGEDDDMFERLRELGYELTRPSPVNGLYTMLHHSRSTTDEFVERFDTLKKWKEHKDTDGLNTLKYEVLLKKNHQLYTLIRVNIDIM